MLHSDYGMAENEVSVLLRSQLIPNEITERQQIPHIYLRTSLLGELPVYQFIVTAPSFKRFCRHFFLLISARFTLKIIC